MKKNEIFRIIDANLNRAREGLRVCEDILRFFLNDKVLTRSFKSTRHQLVRLSETQGLAKQELLRYRNSRTDVGRNLGIKNKNSLNIIGLFSANIQRSEEALRVLEEISKITHRQLEDKFRKMRFKLYLLESKAFKKLLRYAAKKH